MTLRLRSRRRLTAAYAQAVLEKHSSLACQRMGGIEWAIARRVRRLQVEAFVHTLPTDVPSLLATRRP